MNDLLVHKKLHRSFFRFFCALVSIRYYNQDGFLIRLIINYADSAFASENNKPGLIRSLN